MTGLVGAVLEAWDELRVHRVRVLLALVGVAVAVTAITGVTAAVTMLGQAMQEQNERDMGRDVTLSAWSTGPGGTQDAAALDATVDAVAARYDISYHSVESWVQLGVQGGTTEMLPDLMAVDPAYGTIMRTDVVAGRWFTDRDAEQLGPVLVANRAFLDEYAGGAAVAEHPQVRLLGETPVTATVVGELRARWPDEGPRALMLFDHLARWAPEQARADSYRFWVPPETATDLAAVLSRDLTAAGVPMQVDPPYDQPFVMDRALQWVVLGVGGFALLLGGLGLLNISLVTVRYRIREIGIRRSFGATGGRVFFGVLMESVVATTVAGVVGVVAAVAVVKNIPVEAVFGTALQDEPGFPFSAALTGMACAVAVGALAGLIPAVYAVRVKVIDAIRY
ncbi:ABC transporter permease [Puerhibacterium puerhi]|uniref:ABC transporter permease n=1 Tax=Puerhibacterium puerhi TaxID=2692623 RepID=UPI00135BD8A3|nr:ABC transporter permease [Puerhibacterium puerhi]